MISKVILFLCIIFKGNKFKISYSLENALKFTAVKVKIPFATVTHECKNIIMQVNMLTLDHMDLIMNFAIKSQSNLSFYKGSPQNSI